MRFHLDSRPFSYWNARRDRWQVASRNIAARDTLAMRGGSCPG